MKTRNHLAVLASLVLSVAAHANLVLNPGFENSLDNWTGTGSAGTHILDGLDPTHSGNYMAYINAYPGYGTVSQAISTEIGETYRIDFWLSSNGGSGHLYAAFGDTILFEENNPPLPIGIFYYTLFSYDAVATSPTSIFTFGGSGITATYFIDDVSVVAIASVPEPSAYAAIVGTMSAVIVVFRKRKPA